MFVPGSAILKILKPGRISFVEFTLLAVGVSVAFLMFVGAIINQIYPFFGYLEPLSSLSLILTLNIFSTILLALCYLFEDESAFPWKIPFDRKIIMPVFALLFLPILSILGALMVRFYLDNSVLMLLVIIISLLVFLFTFSKKLPFEVYPIAIIAIALALLFHEELTTPYIYGYDMHLEYYLFMTVKQNAIWKSITIIGPAFTNDTPNYNAMLSITVLPTIFSNFLNLSGEYVYKIIYPLIFSSVPLALFKIYKKPLGNKAAFLSVFFFMGLFTFYRELMSLGRQMIAELFFVLLLFLFLDEKIDKRPKAILFIIFTLGLAVSHYSTSYVYLYILTFAWILTVILKKKTGITKFHVGFTFAAIFSWAYFSADSSLLKDIVTFFTSRYNALINDFFSSSARQSDVLNAVGLGGAAESLGHAIGRNANYLVEIFLIVGFLAVILFRKRLGKVYSFQRSYLPFAFASITLLLMSMVLPFFASALNVSRIYHLVLFALAPFFVIGGLFLFKIPGKIIKKFRKGANIEMFALILVTVVLISYFSFNIGFVYEATGDVPFSSALSMKRMQNMSDPSILYSKYVTDCEVNSAQWLSNHATSNTIFCDYDSRMHVLTSYGLIDRDDSSRVDFMYNQTQQIHADSYIYLRKLNVVYGEMTSLIGNWNISDVHGFLQKQNLVFSNGESLIYQVTSK